MGLEQYGAALLLSVAAGCFGWCYGTYRYAGDVFHPWALLLYWLQRKGVPDWALKPFGLCEACLAFWAAVALTMCLLPWPCAVFSSAAPAVTATLFKHLT